MDCDLPEPIRILSDLHLGHPASLIDDVNALRPLLEGAGTVIFNGDTVEERSAELDEQAVKFGRQLDELLDDLGIESRRFLTGNHDPKASSEHYVELCQGKLLVTHGDFLFRYVSPWSKKLRRCRSRIDAILEASDHERLERDLDYRLAVTRRCCEALEVSQHEFSPTLAGWIRLLVEECWPPTRVPTILHVWATAPRLMAEALERYRPEAKAAIFGHIHRPGRWHLRDRWLINTGAFLSLASAQVVDVRGMTVTRSRALRRGEQWERRFLDELIL